MSKNLRRIAILLAAVCVMMIMAVPTFAANGMNGKGNGYYLVGNETIPTYATTDTVKVKVLVQSRQYSNSDTYALNLDRTVSLTGKTAYTVSDVMLQFNSDSTTVYACDNNGNQITSSSDTVDNFVYGSRWYNYFFWEYIPNVPNLLPGDRIPVDGWMFRVNGRSPLLSLTGYNNGPEGAYMTDTPIKDGDVVTFYYNYPFEINNDYKGAEFIAADIKYVPPTGSGNGTLKVQLQKSHDNHSDSQGKWVIDSFTDYGPGTTKYASLYNSNFSYVTLFSLDNDGYGTLSTTLSPGTY